MDNKNEMKENDNGKQKITKKLFGIPNCCEKIKKK